MANPLRALVWNTSHRRDSFYKDLTVEYEEAGDANEADSSEEDDEKEDDSTPYFSGHPTQVSLQHNCVKHYCIHLK